MISLIESDSSESWLICKNSSSAYIRQISTVIHYKKKSNMLPAIVVVLFLGSRGSKADLGYIRTSATQGNRQFYDEAGRARLFHGGNRVPKASPVRWVKFLLFNHI